jgi:hypothetical protein
MHLALPIGLSLIHALAFMLTPTGRAMAAAAWAWLKGLFGRLSASSPRGFLFVIRKKSRRGDELDVLVSTHDTETVARLLQGSSTSLLKQLPAALGTDCPPVPHVPANPEPLPSLFAPPLTASEPLHSNKSESRSVPAKKRRPRTRVGRRPQSSRRMRCACRHHRSSRAGKRQADTLS